MKPSKHQQDILLALHKGDRLHHAGAFTFLLQNKTMRIQYTTGNALLRAGLIEVDEHPYYRLSEVGQSIVRAILKGEAA